MRLGLDARAAAELLASQASAVHAGALDEVLQFYQHELRVPQDKLAKLVRAHRPLLHYRLADPVQPGAAHLRTIVELDNPTIGLMAVRFPPLFEATRDVLRVQATMAALETHLRPVLPADARLADCVAGCPRCFALDIMGELVPRLEHFQAAAAVRPDLVGVSLQAILAGRSLRNWALFRLPRTEHGQRRHARKLWRSFRLASSAGAHAGDAEAKRAALRRTQSQAAALAAARRKPGGRLSAGN